MPSLVTVTVIHGNREVIEDMEQRNVTVSLPVELLREVRHMALDRGVSLSRFIALLLEQQVEERQRYEAARDRQVSLLRLGPPLGTQGRVVPIESPADALKGSVRVLAEREEDLYWTGDTWDAEHPG